MEIQMATAAALNSSRHLAPANSEKTMIKWSSPRIVERPVGLEINYYEPAELN